MQLHVYIVVLSVSNTGSEWGSSADGDSCWLDDGVFGFHLRGIFVMVAQWFMYFLPSVCWYCPYRCWNEQVVLFFSNVQRQKIMFYVLSYKGYSVTRCGMWNRCHHNCLMQIFFTMKFTIHHGLMAFGSASLALTFQTNEMRRFSGSWN